MKRKILHRLWVLPLFAGAALAAMCGPFSLPSFSAPPPPPTLHSVQAAGVTFSWRNDAQNIYCVMEAPTQGWMAVGFDPEKKMKGANIIIGYVKDAELFLRDDFGTGLFGHKDDEFLTWEQNGKSISGKNDVIDAKGTESAEKKTTRIEFTYPLNTGEPFDKPLTPGKTYKIILAQGRSDDFGERHSDRGSAEITLDPVPTVKARGAKTPKKVKQP